MLERVRQTAVEPNPDRFREPEPPEPPAKPKPAPAPRPKKERVKKGRTTIPLSVSLFQAELDKLEKLVTRLERAGVPNPNPSLIVREALQRLEEETEKLSDADFALDFLKRSAKRRSA